MRNTVPTPTSLRCLRCVFEPFPQVNARRRAATAASGLGLHIVLRLIGLMRGTIDGGADPADGAVVDGSHSPRRRGEVGRGSTFRVWLPDLQELESTAPLSVEL